MSTEKYEAYVLRQLFLNWDFGNAFEGVVTFNRRHTAVMYNVNMSSADTKLVFKK